MAELRQYDPIQVVGSWSTPAGVVDILDGRISGEFFSTSKDNPRWSREFDAHGNATRVKNNNRGGSFSVTLSASSPTNAILSARVAADYLSENLVGPMILKDLNGDTVLEADGCFIEDVPDLSFGQERGSRTWVFQCAALRIFAGGHELA